MTDHRHDPDEAALVRALGERLLQIAQGIEHMIRPNVIAMAYLNIALSLALAVRTKGKLGAATDEDRSLVLGSTGRLLDEIIALHKAPQ